MGRRRKSAFDRGRWQLHRERCHIADKRPNAPDGRMVAMQDAISGAMKRLGLEEPLWLHALEVEWLKLVGREIAKHARPGRYKNGCLVIFVDSSVWLSELKRYENNKLLTKLQRRFGARNIKTVSLQPDPDGAHCE